MELLTKLPKIEWKNDFYLIFCLSFKVFKPYKFKNPFERVSIEQYHFMFLIESFHLYPFLLVKIFARIFSINLIIWIFVLILLLPVMIIFTHSEEENKSRQRFLIPWFSSISLKNFIRLLKEGTLSWNYWTCFISC